MTVPVPPRRSLCPCLPASVAASRKLVAIDTETTGLRPYQGDKATLVTFATDTASWALRPADAKAVLRRYVTDGWTVVNHNSPFDRAVFATSFGVEIPDLQVQDTQAREWLLNENMDLRLKEGCATRRFGADAKAEKRALDALMRGRTQADVYRTLRQELLGAGTKEPAAATRERAKVVAAATRRDWAQLGYDDDVFRDYGIADAELALDLYDAQDRDIDARRGTGRDVAPALERESLVAGLMYRLTRTGVRVNTVAAEAALAEARGRQRILAAELPSIDLASAPQVQRWLFEELKLPVSKRSPKTGAPSADKEALERLRWHPAVEALLSWRELGKAISAYFLPLLDRQAPDGRVHASFSAHRVKTGRLSCSGPNLMTIPREDTNAAIRELFVPEPGMVLVSADLPNAELRVAACLAKERLWLQAFEEGRDLHQEMATAMGVSRSTAKTANFALLYGAGPKKLAGALARGSGQEPDLRAAYATVDRYWDAAPRVKRLMDGLGEVWPRRGYLPHRTPGRYRHYEGAYGHEKPYTALNGLVQGGVANLVLSWMLEAEGALRELGARMCLQVHDSLVVEAAPGTEDQVARVLQAVLDDVNPYSLPFPLGGVKAGI